MHCCDYFNLTGHTGDPAFTIEVNQFTFGTGCLNEVGDHAKALSMQRVAVFTDQSVAKLPYLEQVKTKLRAAGLTCVVYDECAVEPTDASFQAAGNFARRQVRWLCLARRWQRDGHGESGKFIGHISR
jgi:hydroxyacid-oxoacid transhydrogenase